MSIHKKDDKEEIKFTTNDNHTNYPKPPTILHTGTIKDGSDIPKKTLLVHEVFHVTDSEGNVFVSEKTNLPNALPKTRYNARSFGQWSPKNLVILSTFS